MLGQRFGRWTVIQCTETYREYLCKCECGVEKRVDKYNLSKGKSQSCGCLNKELASKRITTHGFGNQKKDRLYRTWLSMRQRCYDSGSSRYSDYGGRDIKICDEWYYDFTTFRNWAMENGYSDKLSLDRIDNDGNYEPNNCRWSTQLEQANNRRSNVFINVNGENITLAEVSRRTGIKYYTLCSRYRRGSKSYEELTRSRKKVKQ